MNHSEKIEAWFQKWFHGKPGFSDNQIQWDHLQAAKQDLLKSFADVEHEIETSKKK